MPKNNMLSIRRFITVPNSQAACKRTKADHPLSSELLLEETAFRGCLGVHCPQVIMEAKGTSWRQLILKCVPTKTDTFLAAPRVRGIWSYPGPHPVASRISDPSEGA